ncbi:hypothetical protein [Actinospongicola halichondriae]|uniref:hypothetical protein n=1 Tax=Actinospongicola halichondriae TaxID=3236844 RepID=UPI003D590445
MPSRSRAALATLATPPWRRAHRLLLRRPSALAAVAGACAVMAAAAASVPLFVSSVGTAANEVQAEERCGPDTGATVLSGARPSEVRDPGAGPFQAVSGQLGPTDRWVQALGVGLVGSDPEQVTEVSVMARDEAMTHVEVLEGPQGDGLWISDRAADESGLALGDSGKVGASEVRVAAIYRDLAALTVDDYWCSNAPLVLVEERNGELVPPPPLVLVDRDTFADFLETSRPANVFAAWQAPLRPDLEVGEAEVLAADLACRGERSGALPWCTSGQPLLRGGSAARDDAHFLRSHLDSSLPYVIDRTKAIQVSVGSGVWPVAGFAAVAGMGLVVASSSLWFDRRRREVVLLTVRGASPAALGLKAVLELVPALVVAPGIGLGLAFGAVTVLGPSPVFEDSAIRDAVALTVVAGVVSAVTVAVSVALRARGGGHRTGRSIVRLIPWEIAAAAVTLAAYRRLGEWGVPVDHGGEVSRVEVFGLLFPVLAMFTAVAFFVRLVLALSRPARFVTRSAPMAVRLAVRRVAFGRTATAGLLAAAAIAAGVLGYAATMERSMHATLDTKAAAFVGADTAVRVPAGTEVPAALTERTTSLMFLSRAWVEVDGQQESAAVLAVDPATFAQVAFWDTTFADRSLDDLVTELTTPGRDSRIPAVVLGTDVGSTAEVSVNEGQKRQLSVAPLEGVEAFPGMRRAEITVVVAAESLADLGLRARTELWIRGDHDETLRLLDGAGTVHEEIRRASDVADGASFRTVTWTFGFMQVLGVFAGLLVVGAVFVHLDARHRERLLAHAFLRRMGLGERQHAAALAVELAASVLIGCWTGLVIAVGAAAAAHGRMDPVPLFEPAPVLRPAVTVLAASAVVAVVLVAAGALVSQRRLERDDPVEVLRAGA